MRAVTVNGVTFRFAVTGLFKVAVIVTMEVEVTAVVNTEKAAVVWPAAIGRLDEANVATAGLLLDNWTTAGAMGAAVSLTRPATVVPPSTLAGGPSVMDWT